MLNISKNIDKYLRYICSLGAFYSFLNKFSFYQIDIEKNKCNGCKDTCSKGAILSGFNIKLKG
jgi:polyferredoxin